MPPPAQSPARWLKTFALASLFLYSLPFALVRIPSFEHWGGSPFGPALDFPYTLSHVDADILIFGDSSAAVGIDPRLLSAQLGLKIISLPNTAASLQVLGQSGLDHYLAANKAPRLIVFYFAAWNLDYAHQPLDSHVYEGEEILFRRGTWSDLKAFTLSHPAQTFNFPQRFYLTNPENALRNLVRHRHPAADVAASQGYFDPLLGRPPIPTPCTIPPELVREVPTDTVVNLLSRYGGQPQHHVVLFLAPMPACTNIKLLINRNYCRISPEGIQSLPIEDFKQDFAFVHLRPPAVPANTARLAALLRPILARDD